MHQLEKDQRQNRAGSIYWKLLLACELRENEKDERRDTVDQSSQNRNYTNRMALALMSSNTKVQYHHILTVRFWILAPGDKRIPARDRMKLYFHAEVSNYKSFLQKIIAMPGRNCNSEKQTMKEDEWKHETRSFTSWPIQFSGLQFERWSVRFVICPQVPCSLR